MFSEPTGGWFVPFVGYTGRIIPKHIMKEFVGAKLDYSWNLQVEASVLQDVMSGRRRRRPNDARWRDLEHRGVEEGVMRT
jgi:hypothetical protein